MSDRDERAHDVDLEQRSRSATITEHALERWIERVCCEQDDVAPWDIEEAFERAVSVGIPGERSGRLHEPTGMVFVYNRDWSAGPPVVITVLYADRMGTSLNVEHLKHCPECGHRFHEGVEPCPWCSESTF